MQKIMKTLKHILFFLASVVLALWVDSFLASAINGKIHIPKLIGGFGAPTSVAWITPFLLVFGIILCIAFAVVYFVTSSRVKPETPNGYSLVFFVSAFSIFVPLIIGGQDPIKVLLNTEHFILAGLIYGIFVSLKIRDVTSRDLKHVKAGFGLTCYITIIIFMHYDYEWGTGEYYVKGVRLDEYKEVEVLAIHKPDEDGSAWGVDRTEASVSCEVNSRAITTQRGSLADRLGSYRRTTIKILWCEDA